MSSSDTNNNNSDDSSNDAKQLSADSSKDKQPAEQPEKQPEERSEQTPAVETKADKKAPKKITTTKEKKSRSGALLFLAFIIILSTAGAAGYYFWLELQKELLNMQADLDLHSRKFDKTLPTLDQARADLLRQQKIIEQLQSDNQQQLKQLEEFATKQQTVIKSMQNVFDITHRNQRQWLLAEVSYLLSLANQRLLVSRDIIAATAALKSANNRLHDLADPSLLKLRQQIAKEIASLNLLKLPDINGIAFYLDNTLALISQLPFKSAKQKTIESSDQSEKIELSSLQQDSYFAPLWERVKGLVTIKKHNREIQQTETPLEKSAIDNLLKFRIESSRLSLINLNTTSFNYEMKTALELLSFYYDKNDSRVTELSKELSNFSNTNLTPDLPDITESWKQLQSVIAVNDALESLDKTAKVK